MKRKSITNTLALRRRTNNNGGRRKHPAASYRHVPHHRPLFHRRQRPTGGHQHRRRRTQRRHPHQHQQVHSLLRRQPRQPSRPVGRHQRWWRAPAARRGTRARVQVETHAGRRPVQSTATHTERQWIVGFMLYYVEGCRLNFT